MRARKSNQDYANGYKLAEEAVFDHAGEPISVNILMRDGEIVRKKGKLTGLSHSLQGIMLDNEFAARQGERVVLIADEHGNWIYSELYDPSPTTTREYV